MRNSRLAAPIAATLRGLEGVDDVRVNAACGSLTLRHPGASGLSERQISKALRAVLSPASPEPRKRSERARPLPASPPIGRPASAHPQGSAPCVICHLKLKALRWLLSDLWRCWRDLWVRRLRDRTVWIPTLRGD
ncbi:hypothetical protein [Thiorhodococcus minor]|uniref:hypothetical protein n=1 Tax=Thiorhodococcus minor TaxID=57489 RepID=UPI003CC9131B